ncbi:hypothetical protein Tco_0892828 [Tanacetum coccineum]|uniref:Uncharacterized protein n=1 Tax=Tanacetum coccineum TaxID=301880 RepID=A0ABQ5CA89_9ASTR
MVTCLEKSEENVEFHQIVDFLSTCSINYTLTVNPTIYTSYIEQFLNTATSKTFNSVKQIHAIVDNKVVVISESSVRSDLLFSAEDGKVTPLFDSMLVQNQAPESEGSATPPEPQPTPSTSQPNVSEPQTEPLQTETPPPVFHEPQSEAHIEQILQSPTTYQRKRKTQKRRRTNKDTKLPQTSVPQDLGADEAVHKEGVTVWQSQAPRHHGGAPAQTRSERVLEKPNEPPLLEGHTSGSGEGRMEHQFELTANVPITPHDSPLPRGLEYKLLGNVDAKDMYVYKLTRADGSSSYHGDMQAFLRRLDRKDLNDLYRLVQERFQDHPLEGHDLLLWGDLRMLFDPDEKDELWMNKLDWKLLKWKLHENCRVHTLFMDGTLMEINMLVEKKYPLIKELLEKVPNLQLEAEEESTMAFELIKFIKSMLEE